MVIPVSLVVSVLFECVSVLSSMRAVCGPGIGNSALLFANLTACPFRARADVKIICIYGISSIISPLQVFLLKIGKKPNSVLNSTQTAKTLPAL